MKHSEMSCTAGVCSHQKSEILDGVSVFVCVCVCVCVSLVMQVHFPVCSGGFVMSLYYTHEAETMGCN